MAQFRPQFLLILPRPLQFGSKVLQLRCSIIGIRTLANHPAWDGHAACGVCCRPVLLCGE